MKTNIIFELPAEAVKGATEALLLGDFNNWTLENAFLLEEQEDGSFKTIVPLEVGETYQYRFLLNDGRWVNDYNAQNYVPVAGFSVDNCVITVPEILDIEVTQKDKSKKKKETAKAKANVSAKSGDKKVKKTDTTKAKKIKDTTEKTKAKKSDKPGKKETGKTKK